MQKKEIIKHFRRMPTMERKEQFMCDHRIAFVYDDFDNVTVFADDGTLQLFPIRN